MISQTSEEDAVDGGRGPRHPMADDGCPGRIERLDYADSAPCDASG